MSDWILYVILAGGVAFAVSSWWGVRRLRARHIRSAVREDAHKPGPGSQKVAVILNPVKVNSDVARKGIMEACELAGWDAPRFYETTVEDPGYGQTRQALAHGAEVVLACGGDGTVRVVAECLAHKNVALGLIPLGTGNLLARNVDLDVTSMDDCIQNALFGHQRFIDTATMTISNSITGESSAHTFLVIAGMGLDAEVMGDTKEDLKKSVGWLAYTEAGVRHLPGRRKRVSITLDDEPEQSRKIRSVLFANCGLIPGGIDFIPQAMVDDGMLDIVVMSPRSAFGWIAMYTKILFKHKHNLPMMSFYRSGKVTIRSQEPMATQLDGDPSGEATKVTVQVEPGSLLVRVPKVASA
ncbi:diacylglycerol kinase family protein [Paenarthrobacter ilicis]|uniref:Diacylglycerol kinase family enzyme n=1 Tax=Paenarthrobacter ilicis TaxID=43665 RepID=A0ABX0TLU1_9MICC|nr:diacylglycerol kinase family protein [Paenarthrobacter ilicis]MBM7791527.1 diacylglycerol kinase family enzyme [Paenarthrobacter ilicis]NIJ02795.1 diacylglycerol kinase family enzyme [Paenarthrobacter ilicis]